MRSKLSKSRKQNDDDAAVKVQAPFRLSRMLITHLRNSAILMPVTIGPLAEEAIWEGLPKVMERYAERKKITDKVAGHAQAAPRKTQ